MTDTLATDSGHSVDGITPVVAAPVALSLSLAAAVVRHEQAATAAEVRQAASELAAVVPNRPQGSYAQLHSTPVPSVAVPDPDELTRLRNI